MGVRVSFLSSSCPRTAGLSVALVAVSVGLRLAEDQMTYPVALFVLLLAPEAYLPLRLVGQHFHAAAGAWARPSDCSSSWRPPSRPGEPRPSAPGR